MTLGEDDDELKPALVASITEDDDDHDLQQQQQHQHQLYANNNNNNNNNSHERLVHSVRATKGANRDALAYLLRYETMVRQQEAEDMATLAHIRPCVERLEALAGILPCKQNNKSLHHHHHHHHHHGTLSDSALLTREISFGSLKRALEALEENHATAHASEFMTTDRQLMMVLRLLTLKTATTATDEAHHHHSTADDTTYLAWAEFFQAYKICIVGMLTLQHLPPCSAIRQRARDRTLAMLSLFEAPSTQLFQTASGGVDSAALNQEPHRTGAASYASDATTLSSSSWWWGSGKRKRRRRAVAVVVLMMMMIVMGINISISAVRSNHLNNSVINSPPHPRVAAGTLKSSAPNSCHAHPTTNAATPSLISSSFSAPRDTPSTRSPSWTPVPTVSKEFKPAATVRLLTPANLHRAATAHPQHENSVSRSSVPSISSHKLQALAPWAPHHSRVVMGGGVVGLAVVAVPWIQTQLVAAAATASAWSAVHVACSAVIWGAGLVSVTAVAVGGLFGLVWRWTGQNHHHDERKHG